MYSSTEYYVLVQYITQYSWSRNVESNSLYPEINVHLIFLGVKFFEVC